ncbi:hypothetical protein RB195_005568 [Necator americanus]|uniref:Uncharacterized protein n=1 Tax=Necator americanus TaxID=51031 RepID=A0ABR1BNI4_NECAM
MSTSSKRDCCTLKNKSWAFCNRFTQHKTQLWRKGNTNFHPSKQNVVCLFGRTYHCSFSFIGDTLKFRIVWLQECNDF